MPTYCHECTNPECNYEWEDEYSIKDEPPKVCPKCNKETAKRIISGGSGKGIVQLGFQEMKEKIKEDAKKITHDANTNEKTLANFLGESRYHQLQLAEDRKPRRRK